MNTGFGGTGFGQPAAGGGFGQPAGGGFGQPASGGFGQAAQTAPSGFGQPAAGFGQAAGGFGQQNTGFGQQQQVGLGQPAQSATGFAQAGQGAAAGFGQPAGGFGQQNTGFGQQNTGFGQQGAGFGQQTAGFGQPSQGTGVGFGQPGNGQFGQPGATTGFGQQQTGFGQVAGRGATTGFGQPGATGGFGQTAATPGFGQQAGGFGQAAGRGATTGFGQPGATGGFGQTAATPGFGQQAGGFGQAAGRGATTGFGQPGATGGFGQTAATPGFGQQAGGFGQAAGRGATTGFGQPGATGGFGQTAATPGFGQQAGGFGQAAGRGATTGFGQPGATGGFGQTAATATGGFGQTTTATGGFGQTAATATGGFGQTAATPGFGQQAGGFGQAAGRGATTGFGQPGATGGFGQTAATATGGFGQTTTATGGFGQTTTATGGFGQTTTATGGFGQAATATGGFGQAATATGGFGQPGATGGFGQMGTASAGGFGQAGRGTTFGGPTGGGFGSTGGGFGSTGGGFGQMGGATATGVGANTSANSMPFLNLPDFADKPYGNVLLFAPEEEPPKPAATPALPTASTVAIIPTSMSHYQQRIKIGTPAPNASATLKQQSASFSTNALSPVALRDLISSPKVTLGIPDEIKPSTSPTAVRALLTTSTFSAPDSTSYAPTCTSSDYILDPPLEVLQEFSIKKLQSLPEFSIYRRDGKCSVRFLEPVNLVRCDISDIVALHPNGEVVFYPDVKVPPPLGHGLRVRARVTVNGVVDTTADELCALCRRNGYLFDSYDSKKGTWVYTTNISDDEEDDTDDDDDDDYDMVDVDIKEIKDEDKFPPEIERISTYGESVDDDVVHTPAALNMSKCSRQLTPTRTGVVPPASLTRIFSRADQSSVLPVRTQGVTVRDQMVLQGMSNENVAVEDIKLPYNLPDIHQDAPLERKGAMLIKGSLTEIYTPVYVVKKTNSKMYEMNASVVSQSTMGSLGRSFRCGWRLGGNLAVPLFAWLRDGTENRKNPDEVSGAQVSVMNPFFAHATSKNYLQSCAISVLRTICRYLHLVEGSCGTDDHFSMVFVNLCRQSSNVSLSSEKLRELITAIDAVRCERISVMEKSTARQAKTVLNLLDALYGLPETDKAESNAVAENRYLKQLRRRNLNNWLKGELSFMDSWTEEDLGMNSTQKLLCKLLCHKLKDAISIAKTTGNTELSRVLGICGDGNQFGSYVATANTKSLDEDISVRERVVSLLSGVVEPFITQPRFKRLAQQEKNNNSNDVVSVVPLAATWKQLLGVFAFYGCTPDTPAEDIIAAFLDRLHAPASREENAFPPYADHIAPSMLKTTRGQDFIHRGDEFQDAALSLLEGFTMGVAPAASALHPHASSYCASDYLTPFLILVAIRALKLERTENYKDAETKVLIGFSAALECLNDAWFWALLPLHMIEELNARVLAVKNCLRRNALRFKESNNYTNNADYRHIVELIKADVSLLEPECLPEEAPLQTPANAPSIRAHTSLQDALRKFRRDFCKQ
ncbi:Nuclear protein 96 [Trypanosoma melophagium]|uniref:Nuclear protein 96 n=1 Tax=Trypanosoma melophagium TaxID=715481 RepID=UPI00351A19B9|nr:Nuclear protein 96 [Trypanosoma melophagium]